MNKEVGMNAILKQSYNKANSYRPKHVSGHRRIKSTPTPKNRSHKRIQYANIRTNQSIVDTLKGYQMAVGYPSRSALLKDMIKMCRPMLLNNGHRKAEFDKEMKAIHIQREVQRSK